MTTSTSTVSEAVVSKLEAELLSDKAVVTRKYRALFALRNVASATAVRALERCLLQAEADDSQSARESSALLKHEVAYALGQVGLVSSIPTLERVLGDAKAHPMVRHEVSFIIFQRVYCVFIENVSFLSFCVCFSGWRSARCNGRS